MAVQRSEQVILLVEDNDDDAELTIEAFRRANIENEVVRATDGVKALDYLFARNEHARRNPKDLPCIVLLDLNLPRMSGIDVLKEVRANNGTRHLPIVMLTSSIEERDRLAAYSNFVNSYVRKPVDYDHFLQVSKELGMYWLTLNEPPPIEY